MNLKQAFKNYLLKALTLLTVAAGSLFLTQAASATDLVISDNGTGSGSEVTLSANSTTTVTQSNTLSITNNITNTANTGDNEALANTGGDSSITTGDISTMTSVTNVTNVSSVNAPCCQESASNMTISGNGSDSQNSINTFLSAASDYQINQIANIKNSISGSANTGSNTASDNTGGTTSIATGNITTAGNIKNHHINISTISAGQGIDFYLAKIFGNGADSQNYIDVAFTNNFQVMISNLASISNTLDQDANTGGNSASNNSGGDVIMATGDITIDNVIDNGPINQAIVEINCCQNGGGVPEDGEEGIPQSAPASSASSSGSSGSSGGGGGGPGQVLAAALSQAGQILPVTGSLWTILLTLASVMMFVLGLYLRLHPGQDPGRQLALAY